MNAEREPTPDQLKAMAYADGELQGDERKTFEEQMASRSDLAREVAQYRKLQILARQVAGPEPIDTEWARLSRDPLHRSGLGLGYALLLVAAVAAVGLLGWSVVDSDMDVVGKVLVGSGLVGFLVLFFVYLRARLRALPYDPYTEVKR